MLLAVSLTVPDARAESSAPCAPRFSQGFQRLGRNTLAQKSKAQIEQQVAESFGPPQELCEAGAYEAFMTAFTRYAVDAIHRKGPEQEARITAAIAVLARAPTQVPAAASGNKVSAYQQARSDLSVVAREVGHSHAAVIRPLLDAVDKLGEPRAVTAVGGNAAVEVAVPKVPLPAWAVSSLHEIREHAKNHEDGAISAKVGLILEWMRLVSAGVPPEDIRLAPYPPPGQAQNQAPGPAQNQAPAAAR
ncbi:MAG: hypothetical protein U1A78_08535 [Polyangia bacterium]